MIIKKFFMPTLLACGLAAASAHAADLNSRLNVANDPRPLLYGEIVYDFYTDKNFDALNKLKVAKAKGTFTDNDADTEIILADLYSAFGLPAEAEKAISHTVSKTVSTTSNITWLQQARMLYRQNHLQAAEKVLSENRINLTPEQDAERRLLLGTVMMKRTEFSGARHLLSFIPDTSERAMYARYNMGISNLRVGRSQEGIELLQQVMNQPAGNEEVNALKDRAALAIAYHLLQKKQHDKAREALVNVRLQGPFSNSAMLALGYAHAQRNDYQRALPFWVELSKRRVSDASVQEAMLLAARGFEELGGDQQAIDAYNLAINTYQEQLRKIDELNNYVQQPEWLATLSPDAKSDSNILSTQAPFINANSPEAAYLYSLYASNHFSEALKQYHQLKKLRALLDQRAGDMRALDDLADNLKAQTTAQQASIPRKIQTLTAKKADLTKRWESTLNRSRSVGRYAINFIETATVEDSLRLQRMRLMEQAIERMADSAQKASLKERFRRVYGLSLWKVATNAPASQMEWYKGLQETNTELEYVQQRLEALQQLANDGQNVLKSNPQARTQQLASRITTLQARTDKSIKEHQAYLTTLSQSTLNTYKERLNKDLAEAYMNMARLQERAVTQGSQPASQSVRMP